MPKRFICLLFTLCLLVRDVLLPAVVAQSGITQTTATLNEARYNLAATSSGALVFFGGGYNATGPSDRVDIYNVTSGSWTTATLSVPRAFLAAASSGSLVFFAGGWNGTTASNQVDIYNVSDGSWSTATLIQARCCLAATSVGNLVLFGGGWISNLVDICNVTNNTWTTATLSQARGMLTATSVANRYVIFAGGYNGTSSSNVVDIFDSFIGIWNTTTLSIGRNVPAATSLGNLAFFGGGDPYNYGDPFNIVDIYNATAKTWTTATLSQNRTNLAAASIDDIVAFGGGNPNSYSYSAFVDMYNVTNSSWFIATLSQARNYLAAASSTNKIFFGGGQNSGHGYSNTVDIFAIPPPLPPTPSTPLNAGTTPLSPPAVSSPGTSRLPSTFSSTPSAVSSPPQSAPFSPLALHSNTSTGTVLSSIKGTLIGGLIGGLVGALLVAGGIVLLVILLRKKRKKLTSDRSIEVLPMEEQTKTLQTNQQQAHESDTQSQTTNTSPQYMPIAKSTAQSQTSQITQNISLSIKHHIPFEDIEVQKEIGKGSYGKVCLGRWSGAAVALKFCKEKEGLEDFWKETNLMIELPPHPNVVHVFGVSTDGSQPILVLEYCAGGSLDKLLFVDEQPMNETQKITLVKGIAAGLLHLHNHNIIHRDLAARNILLCGTGDPKISDFGMSRILQKEDEGKTKANVGPIRWMAPESLAKRTYSKKSDVWSFGIVVYEIVARREPHIELDPLDVGPLIRDQHLTPKIPDDCPPMPRELMQLCWQADPNQRPSLKEICRLLDH